MPRLSDVLKTYRERKGLTQEAFARNIGVSLNTVQRWESDRTTPSPLALRRIQEVLRDIIDNDQYRLI